MDGGYERGLSGGAGMVIRGRAMGSGDGVREGCGRRWIRHISFLDFWGGGGLVGVGEIFGGRVSRGGTGGGCLGGGGGGVCFCFCWGVGGGGGLLVVGEIFSGRVSRGGNGWSCLEEGEMKGGFGRLRAGV